MTSALAPNRSLNMLKRSCAFVLLWVAAGLPVQAAEAPLLYDMDGGRHSLESRIGRGKWLVVMVWASTCHVCNDEVHEMIDFHNAHHDRDASVLGVAIDGIEEKAAVQAFLDRHRVPFPNLIDDGSVIVAEFNRRAGEPWFGWTPTYLVYNPQGQLTAKQVGAVSRQDLERHILGQTGSARH